MTDKNKTEIAIILDRSGSMASIAADMEGGVNNFLREQAAQPGECIVSVYRFDATVETVFENVNSRDVGKIKLEPRGSTALLDAIGHADGFSEMLAALEAYDRHRFTSCRRCLRQ